MKFQTIEQILSEYPNYKIILNKTNDIYSGLYDKFPEMTKFKLEKDSDPDFLLEKISNNGFKRIICDSRLMNFLLSSNKVVLLDDFNIVKKNNWAKYKDVLITFSNIFLEKDVSKILLLGRINMSIEVILR
jgi:hypothetical protein